MQPGAGVAGDEGIGRGVTAAVLTHADLLLPAVVMA